MKLYDLGLFMIGVYVGAGWLISKFNLVEGAVEAAKNAI